MQPASVTAGHLETLAAAHSAAAVTSTHVGSGPLGQPRGDVLVPPCLSADAELEVSPIFAEPEDLDLRWWTAWVKERRVFDRALRDEVVFLLLERGTPSGVDRAAGTGDEPALMLRLTPRASGR